ncbi:hypothetical protein RFI_12110 [Reticulomyxa filosa]|uniref:Uncharacterized protein n=1 Tax=Reticulomyxa filosa TaxID=46433 RepID=X6NGK9_RETFI|nr:hypothetical protein RFI_12110 [Reticulomyxa filosa]|eukprot:ETO25038.1 hypothetical protein RFI_12110 [Reticulomyxa filosa]
MSVYATKTLNRKKKKLSDEENDGMYQVYQHNSKRQKIEHKVHQLEKIVKNNEEDERAHKETDAKCNLNEEKKNE